MMKQSQRKKQTQTDRHGSYAHTMYYEKMSYARRWKKEKILFAFIIGMIVNFYATAAAAGAGAGAAAGVDDLGLSSLIKTSSSSFVLFKLSICRW